MLIGATQKKRTYDQIDEMDINNPLYGYTYNPRQSKRIRSRSNLSIAEQQLVPSSHPLEILIAAATFVELGGTKLSSAKVKEAAQNWDKILSEPMLRTLKEAAARIDDISTTHQIM